MWAPSSCEWREGKEQLCGADCDPKVWCAVYNGDSAACSNAYIKRTTGKWAECVYNNGACTAVGNHVCPDGEVWTKVAGGVASMVQTLTLGLNGVPDGSETLSVAVADGGARMVDSTGNTADCLLYTSPSPRDRG